jgi:hypothetical protein
MDKWLDVAAALLAIIAAVFWFLPAYAATYRRLLRQNARERSLLRSGEIFGGDEPMGCRLFRCVRAFDGSAAVHR